jgi:hypothetical protein
MIESAFLATFLILYTVFFSLFKHPVLATYWVILFVLIVIDVALYRLIQKGSFKGSFKRRLGYVATWAGFLYVTTMIVWYIVVHFKTHSLMV